MLSRLRELLSRPVAWGAVLLSYVGIFVGFGFAVWTYNDYNDGLRAEAARADARVLAESDRARHEIVRTGRIAIRSSCEFDNQRTRELRGILRASIDPSDTPQDVRRIKQFIRSVSYRDCDKAAAVLTDNPKETP